MSSAQASLIEIDHLYFRYYSGENYVLEDINLRINPGDFVLITGKSGSGKSTLLRAINGLIPHQHSGEYKGSVRIEGLEVTSSKMGELATKVGYVFQNPENQIFMFSVERDIAFGPENLGLPRSKIRNEVTRGLELLGIKNLALRAPHELSDGQKQRVAIAGSIIMGQKILIFDEPTALLDPFTAGNLISLVKKLHDDLGIAVLIVEHRLDLVSAVANRMIVLDHGRIVYDADPRGVMYSSDLASFGLREPSVVKTAKLLASSDMLPDQACPITVAELAASLKKKQRQ